MVEGSAGVQGLRFKGFRDIVGVTSTRRMPWGNMPQTPSPKIFYEPHLTIQPCTRKARQESSGFTGYVLRASGDDRV